MGAEDSQDSSAQTAGNVYFKIAGVGSVRWDSGLQAVVETWEGWANATEFMNMLDAGVMALKENHGSRWLADCRRQRVLKPADQKLGNQKWLPRALAAGLTRFAVVLPASGLAKANIQDYLSKAPATRLEVAYFATVEHAQQWLVQASANPKE